MELVKTILLLPFKAIFTVATLLIPFTVLYPFIGGFVLLIGALAASSQSTLLVLGILWASSIVLYAIGRMIVTNPKEELRFWWQDCCARWGFPTEEEF